jgi:hypothetical protein
MRRRGSPSAPALLQVLVYTFSEKIHSEQLRTAFWGKLFDFHPPKLKEWLEINEISLWTTSLGQARLSCG